MTPPKLVKKPEVVHFRTCHLMKLSIAFSLVEYLSVYSVAKS